MYFYQYVDEITQFNINTAYPEKDTLEYMFTMCHKTEYMRYAIESNPFNTSQFVWVDFGIYHICKCSDEEYITKIMNFNDKEYDGKVRIGSIWNPEIEYAINIHKNIDWYFNDKEYDGKVRIESIWNPEIEYAINIHKNIAWYFAGGIFGGDSNALLQFAYLVKNKCIQTIKDHKTLMWEVNIWYLIYKECPELFSLYKCDHNHTLIDEY